MVSSHVISFKALVLEAWSAFLTFLCSVFFLFSSVNSFWNLINLLSVHSNSVLDQLCVKFSSHTFSPKLYWIRMIFIFAFYPARIKGVKMASSCQNEDVTMAGSSTTSSAPNAQSHLGSGSEGISSAAVSFSTENYGPVNPLDSLLWIFQLFLHLLEVLFGGLPRWF